MGRKCFVENCNSGYASCKEKVILFNVPSDPKRLKDWAEAIPRKDRVLSEKDAVCSKHFTKEMMVEKRYFAELGGSILLDIPKRTVLADDAIPCIFPPAYVKKRKPPTTRKSPPLTRPRKKRRTAEVSTNDEAYGAPQHDEMRQPSSAPVCEDPNVISAEKGVSLVEHKCTESDNFNIDEGCPPRHLDTTPSKDSAAVETQASSTIDDSPVCLNPSAAQLPSATRNYHCVRQKGLLQSPLGQPLPSKALLVQQDKRGPPVHCSTHGSLPTETANAVQREATGHFSRSVNVAVETSRIVDGNMCKSTQTLPVAKKVHRGTETTNMDVQDSGPCAQDISAPDVCALPSTLNTGRNHELNPLRNSRADGVIQHAQRSVHVTIVSVKAAQTEATLLSKSSVDAAFGTSGIDCKDVSKPTQASHATEKVHVWTGTTDLRNFQDNNSGARASPEKKRKKMDVLTFYRATRVKKHAKRRKILDDKSAEAMLLKIGNGDISDVDFSDDDFDDSDVEEVDKNISSATMAETVVRPAISNTTDDASTPSTKLSVKWVDGQLSPSDTACSYQPQIGSPPREPLVYFSQYFSVEIFENLATFTNLYALQGNGELVTTKEELQVFFGILMLMGILKFPRVRMYWQTSTRIPAIADAMTAKRFFKIRLALHITDSNAPQDSSSTDKFWKVRPMLEAVRQRCLQLEPLEHSSIDEQHVAVTGHVSRKRSAKGKPHPRGFKMFVRCSADGLAHDLELYQGKCAGASAQRTDFGHEGSVVMRLVESMPKGMNMKCFMGSYFTSVDLLLELKKIGILATGAIRPDRLPGCMLKTEREMKKKGRGSIVAKVSEAGDITAVRWLDNSVSNVVSTHVGVGNTRKVKRRREATKSHVQIDCPEVIVQYNAYMVGVDKLDFLMSLYPLHTRMRKWPVRVMLHLVSLALCNSWIEYLRDCNKAELPRKSVMDLLAFQSDIAHNLIICNKSSPEKCGILPALRKPLPSKSIRYDGFHHWPEHVATPCAQRCRREGCKSKCRIRCRKCGVFLCLSLQNDCFFLFHNR